MGWPLAHRLAAVRPVEGNTQGCQKKRVTSPKNNILRNKRKKKGMKTHSAAVVPIAIKKKKKLQMRWDIAEGAVFSDRFVYPSVSLSEPFFRNKKDKETHNC